jgi:O-antigen ligase
MIRQKLLSGVVPVYLLMCLLLGGSAQAVLGNLVLQLVGLLILLWALLTPRPMAMSAHARTIAWLVLLLAALIAAQLLPLPFAVWRIVPGRAGLAQELGLLGHPLRLMSMTLDPYATWTSALQLIAPVAIFAGIVRLGAYRGAWLVTALAIGAIAGVMLGVAQVTAKDAGQTSYYLYENVNLHAATGFFANANHMGSLLLCTIPFLAAMIGRARQPGHRSGRQEQSVTAIASGGLIVVLVGIALNRSLAAWLLSPPVIALSALLMFRSRALRLGLGTFVGIALLASPILVRIADRHDTGSAVSVSTRSEMARNTIRAIGDYFPLGSGLGTFVRLYPQYEDPRTVDSTYVVHAHDDYLELLLEAGVPGLMLLTVLLLWFVRRSTAVWRDASTDHSAQAASIAAGALLLHSLVDYPLRTTALASVFAMCAALLAKPRSRRRIDPNGAEASTVARHLSL